LYRIAELAKPMLKDEEIISKLDSLPYLIPVKDGKILEIKEDKLRDRQREDYFTYELRPAYTRQISDEFKTYLKTLFLDDWEMCRAMMRFVGFAMCGVPQKEEKLFILTGNGSNGKSKFLNLVQNTLKGLYETGDRSIFVGKQRNNGPTPELARLQGKRFVCISEPNHDEQLNEAQIKNATGGDEITARCLYQDQFTFVPKFTLFMSSCLLMLDLSMNLKNLLTENGV